ncbi:MAG: hypothetical protein WC655_15385 [Candidatus Hydrogenedentales bacterium]
MKSSTIIVMLAIAVALAGSCTPKAPDAKPAVTPPPAVVTPEETSPTTTANPPVVPTTPAVTEKKQLANTLWDITLKDVKYRLEFTNDTAVIVKGGEAPEGAEGTYSVAADGAFTIQVSTLNLNESGTYDGKVLKIADAEAMEDQFTNFTDSGLGSIGSSHQPKAQDTAPDTTSPAAGTAKNDLPATAWDFTWENTKYKRLEFTSESNVTLKSGDAPKEGIAGTYTLASDGALTLTAGDIKESGSYDGSVLKIAGVEGAKDLFSDFGVAPPNESSSRR